MENTVYNEKWETGLPRFPRFPRFPNKYFDLAICDIPYGINVGKMSYLTEQNTRTKQKNGSRLNARKNKKSYTVKNWDTNTPNQDYFNELLRVSKNQIIFGIEYVDWENVGPGRIKWNKGVPKGVSFKPYELAYCSLINHTEEINLLWSGMMQAKSLDEPMTQQGNKKLNEKRIHPCQKPRLLYRKLIADYGFPGMKMLDSHTGSGSSRIEADVASCNFVGFEPDTEYFKDQEQRYLNFKSSNI